MGGVCARARAGGERLRARGERTFGKRAAQSCFALRAGAQEGWYFLVSCALTLADLGSTKSIVFFACAAGGQEASGAGLLSITAPRGKEEWTPPLLWTPHFLRSVRTLLFLKRCSMGFGPTADGTSSISPIVS